MPSYKVSRDYLISKCHFIHLSTKEHLMTEGILPVIIGFAFALMTQLRAG